jgi:hypothetical protein
MRLTRTASGRLNLDVTDDADYAVARRLAAAILETFRGRRGQSLVDVDGSSCLDVVIAGATVVIRVDHAWGILVFALDEAGDGVILDVANYLGANAKVLGIECGGPTG